jgi:hypothetical protein
MIVAALRISLLALTMIPWTAAWQASDAAARHALVIGNGACPFDPLDNPATSGRRHVQ